MAFSLHNVKSYKYGFSANTGEPTPLQLWDDNMVLRAEIRFVADDVPLPAPAIWPNLTGATIYFKARNLPLIIDMLRNEKPVTLTVNDQPPAGFVLLDTRLEPTGEEEKSA